MNNHRTQLIMILAAVLSIALTGCGSDSPTQPGAGGPSDQPPLQPDSLQTTVDSEFDVLLTWLDRSDNESGFTVVRRPLVGKGSDTTILDTLPPNTVSFLDTTAVRGEHFRYWVGAYNDFGAVASAHADINVPAELIPPNPPSNLRIDRSPSRIVLRWDDNSDDEDGFELLIVPIGSSPGTTSAFTIDADSTAFQVNILPSGAYDISVRSFKDTAFSLYSNTVRLDYADQANLPPAPGNVSLTVDGYSGTLTWDDNASDEIRFHFEFSFDSQFDGEVWTDAVAADRESVTLDLSILGTTGRVYVRMWTENGFGISDYSNVDSHDVPWDNRPDMTPVLDMSDSFPDVLIPGDTISMAGWRVRNLGNSQATFSVDILLYPVQVTPNVGRDRILHIDNIVVGAGNSLQLFNYSYVVPYDQPDGLYYLRIIVDYEDAVYEQKENNNQHAVQISIETPNQPDLVPTGGQPHGFLVLPKSVSVLDTLLIDQWYINNIGGAATSGLCKAGIYISSDSVITKHDIRVKDYLVNVIPPGGQMWMAGTSAIVPPLPSGVYYVGAVVDYDNDIDEVRESNNVLITTVTIE